LVLVGSEWAVSFPSHFTPGERCIGSWEVPRAGLYIMGSENSCLYQDSNSNSLVVQLIDSHFIDCANPAPIIYTSMYIMCTIKCTYAYKTCNNFIFNTIRNKDRLKNERIKKENGGPEQSPFILAVAMNIPPLSQKQNQGLLSVWTFGH
jgi:hypothetical protein